MTMNQRLLRADSRAVEFWTGVFIQLTGLWIWANELFTNSKTSLDLLAGAESWVAIVAVGWGGYHAFTGNSDLFRSRARNAMIAIVLFVFLAFQLGLEYGWLSAGPLFCGLAAIVQMWVYLHDTRMARCWMG